MRSQLPSFDDSTLAAPRPVTRRAVLTGMAVLVAACRTVERDPVAVDRVVSLSPSTTEAVYSMGAGGLLVGRSRYCDYPPEAARLPVVGGFADPSIEAIVALRPTLAVGARGPAGPGLAESLRAHGIEPLFPETESIPQIEAMLTTIGKRLRHEAGAAAVAAAIEGRRAEVARAVSGRPRVRTVMLFDIGPIVAAGPGSFGDALIHEAGGENLITEGASYPTLDLERLIALDPDTLLDCTNERQQDSSRVAALKDRPGWREMRAIREGRARHLATAIVLRPGPRIGDGLVMVARALHGALPLAEEHARPAP
jgi:iron complex transport system substrate-binding protein